MHPLIRPIFHLMNQLTYRGKFVMICSIFAIPLAIFAVQLANSYHLRAEHARVTQEGLYYIQKTNLLIQELETLRDLTVITAWRSFPEFDERHQEQRALVLLKIDELALESSEASRLQFLNSFKALIERDELVIRSELESVDELHGGVQRLLRQVYNWRAKLSYGFVSLSYNNKHILSIINLLNDMDTYAQAIGKARSYGSLYLAQGFIDANGAQALERVYVNLTQLADLTEIKDSEYHPFYASYPEASMSSIKSALLQGRELLHQHLIAAPAAGHSAELYFDGLSLTVNSLYQYKQSLLGLSAHIVEEDYRLSMQRLWAFYLAVLFLGLLLAYLVLGLYYSIAISIRELLKSAKTFSAGNYDKPVKIVANDELTAVAEAMDIMRINIKEREEKLALMSQTDGLTLLSNRKFFDQALALGLANSRRNPTPLTLVMMDIDHFKKVNDDYGHQVGDECLIKIAQLMKEQFQRKTDVVARYGGEEFIAILYGQSLDEALKQTEKLRQDIENIRIHTHEQIISVTASFGLAALIPPQEASADELIALADALLYQSKDKGRNQVSADKFH